MPVKHPNNYPKLHNATWPGLVGKGSPGAEPAIDLDTMIRLLLALVLGLAQAAGAAEYHVAMTGASDANPCTDASHCLTIARGLEVAGAGDTLWIHGGVWTTAITTETMTITGGSSWATEKRGQVISATN